ncbi:hypothetical protein, partial [Mesorhizobium sp. M3A.F.Ca.ET.201.01.1.1]|uniref:hypothetical protein n=1 Tax=Mesorhizobium sp. M3A.F.Ca.ET.201.01.1.1 TaxID=2563946 RepID=UPI001AEE65B7
ARRTVTQRKGNRNLPESLPKRFGFFDLAIELTGSQEGCSTNRFKIPPGQPESALQHAFLALQQQFLLQTALSRH